MHRQLIKNKRLRHRRFDCDGKFVDENSKTPHLLNCPNKAENFIKYKVIADFAHPLLETVFEMNVCQNCFEKMWDSDFAGENNV